MVSVQSSSFSLSSLRPLRLCVKSIRILVCPCVSNPGTLGQMGQDRTSNREAITHATADCSLRRHIQPQTIPDKRLRGFRASLFHFEICNFTSGTLFPRKVLKMLHLTCLIFDKNETAVRQFNGPISACFAKRRNNSGWVVGRG